jgi:hypothetical protein
MSDRRAVWAVYNSGHPISGNMNAAPVWLFETKLGAISFMRVVLGEHYDVDTLGLDDADVEEIMWDDVTDRYFHLYELEVHTDPPAVP